MTSQLITLPARLWMRGARLALHTAEEVTERALTGTLRVAVAIGNLRPGGGNGGAPTAPAAPWPQPSRAPRASEPRPASALAEAGPASALAEAGPASALAEPTPASALPEPDPRIAQRALGDTPPAPPLAPGSDGAGQPLASERLEREGTPATVDLDATERIEAHVSEEPVLVREEAEAGAEEGAGASVTVRAPWDGYDKMKAREVIARLAGASAAELAAVQLYESGHRNRQTVLQAVARERKAADRRR